MTDDKSTALTGNSPHMPGFTAASTTRPPRPQGPHHQKLLCSDLHNFQLSTRKSEQVRSFRSFETTSDHIGWYQIHMFGLVWTAYSQNKAFVISISPWSCLKMSEAASILSLLASSGFGGGSGMKASHSIIFCLGKARSNQVVTSCYICTWMCLGLALNFGLPFFTSN